MDKQEKRDKLYELIKNNVQIIDCPEKNLCLSRGCLNPEKTWLFEKIWNIFDCSY
jgi:hypothetical protein